jgi:hypothetical protein
MLQCHANFAVRMQVIWPRGPSTPDNQIKNRIMSALSRLKTKPDVRTRVTAYLSTYGSAWQPATVTVNDKIIWSNGQI